MTTRPNVKMNITGCNFTDVSTVLRFHTTPENLDFSADKTTVTRAVTVFDFGSPPVTVEQAEAVRTQLDLMPHEEQTSVARLVSLDPPSDEKSRKVWLSSLLHALEGIADSATKAAVEAIIRRFLGGP
jgi:hypothetical protein